MANNRPLRLFISYSHEDRSLRQELEIHLSPLKRQGILEIWSDQEIDVGQEWEKSIQKNLDASDIVLLLISPDFLASDFIYKQELKSAMGRHEAGRARVIPVFLRPCDWKEEVFGKLQGVPDDTKPITEWENRDRAFTIVAQSLRRASFELPVQRQIEHQGAELERQGNRINLALRFIISRFLKEYELVQLQRFSEQEDFIVEPSESLKNELTRLLELKLITRKPGKGIRTLMNPQPRHDVREHFEITEAGVDFLRLRAEFLEDQKTED